MHQVISLERIRPTSPPFYLHRVVFFKRGPRALRALSAFRSRKRWAIDFGALCHALYHRSGSTSQLQRKSKHSTPGLRETYRFTNVPRFLFLIQFGKSRTGLFALWLSPVGCDCGESCRMKHCRMFLAKRKCWPDVIVNIQRRRHSYKFFVNDAVLMFSSLLSLIKC